MRLFSFFSKYKGQYSQTLKLAGPVVLAQIGQVVVQIVDNAMVGRLGALPLASVSFGGTVFFMLFILCMGISMGLTPLVGEMYSKGNHKISARYFQNSILLYLMVGIITFAVQYSIVPLMYHLGQPVEVVDMAIPYYKYLVWSLIPFVIFAAFKQFLEGIGNTTVAMVIVIGSNLVNVLLNYLLIYGNWGFPAMGAAGAGLATLISRICTPLLMIAYFLAKDRMRRYFHFFSLGNFDFKSIRSLVLVGLPIALQMFMEGSAFALSSIMMGWIGTIEIAANQIAITVSNFAFMMAVGIAAATTIRVSHAYGRGDLRELKKVAVSSYHITLAWNAFTALMFISLRNYLPMVFTSDEQVIAMASYLMIFVAAFQFSDGMQVISIGVLRGMQDVNIVMLIAFLSYIVINLPVGYLCAFVFGWGAGGLWIGFIFGLSTAAVLLAIRFRRQLKLLRTRRLSHGAV